MSDPKSSLSPELLARISTYIDGELAPEEANELEALADRDPNVMAEIEAAHRLDAVIGVAFDALLERDGAAELPDVLKPEPMEQALPEPANSPFSPFRSIAAGLALIIAGAGIGYYGAGEINPPVRVVESPGWMAQVADYHRVYATQSRHLVEVPASERDHIEAWLGKVTGVSFKVPDLSASGFTFQGARLLVASGKPVFQLLYLNEAGQVLAICGLEGGDPDTAGAFNPRSFGDVHMVNWKSPEAAFVVVGEEGMDLEALATKASETI